MCEIARPGVLSLSDEHKERRFDRVPLGLRAYNAAETITLLFTSGLININGCLSLVHDNWILESQSDVLYLVDYLQYYFSIASQKMNSW